MYNPNADTVTLADVKEATERITSSEYFKRTPCLKDVGDVFDMPGVKLHLKLENTQTTGSFKIRGVLNQFLTLPDGCGSKQRPLISMSAGNYGKAFAFLCNKMALTGHIVMPDTAPDNRAQLIQGFGVTVERAPTSQLQDVVDGHVAQDHMMFLHSFDDTTLIAGHGSAGLEILADVADVDIVLVCCGGGGLVSGIAAAIKLSGNEDCRVYAVEPTGSRTMHESYRQGKAVSMAVKSVASGLSPPFAGPNTFRHCQQFVEDVLLVSDQELLDTMFFLHSKGLYVEPSGSAAFAALRHGKVRDAEGRSVVVVVTGGNVTPAELVELQKLVT